MAGYSKDSQINLDTGFQASISLSESWIEGLFM